MLGVNTIYPDYCHVYGMQIIRASYHTNRNHSDHT